jgi:DNA-directed RNA polymerase specialized sigma24 family protein
VAKRKAAVESNDPETLSDLAKTAARLVRLLALLLVKGEEQAAKAASLSAAGFTPAEISDLLGISSNAVSVTLYKRRKRKKEK